MLTAEGVRHVSRTEWLAEAAARFGRDPHGWWFVCPSCGHVEQGQAWADVGAMASAGVNCVGRYLPDANLEVLKDRTFNDDGGPCCYVSGGMICVSPVSVSMDGGGYVRAFEFASEEQVAAAMAERKAKEDLASAENKASGS